MRSIGTLILALTQVLAPALVWSATELNVDGCRVLSLLPREGEHPRVLFTKEEFPLIKKRLEAPAYREAFKVQRQQLRDRVMGRKQYAELDPERIDEATVEKLFGLGEGLGSDWGGAAILAIVDNDGELKERMIKNLVGHAHLVLKSKQLFDQGRKGKWSGVWEKPDYNVGVAWTFGAAGYAIAYDVLYNDMTEKQRDIVAKAIATATTGRRSYGMEKPRGFATSNHYGYHGDLMVMMAAIEGHPDFDQETWDNINQVMRDYWEISYTDMGFSREDGYGPNLGMRAGGLAYLVMARRGYNIFDTDKYRNFINYMAQDLYPFENGAHTGGASGGPYGELYHSGTLIMLCMYPKNQVANFVWRHHIGEKYDRKFRWQTYPSYVAFGSDWEGPASRDKHMESLSLPLSVFYPVRGKFIARSAWAGDATYLIFDARPDAHTIGHDKVDRGNFSMASHGRVWAFSGNFSEFDQSTESSLVHIDGMAQAWKAPAVRFLWQEDDGKTAGGAADLKYAYDWQWTPPWPNKDRPLRPEHDDWEPEKSSPDELGWPTDQLPPALSGPIFMSESGYGNTNFLHRHPYNPVEKAIRSAFLVRGNKPYVLICDDICKDDQEHSYEWYLQFPMDVAVKDMGTGDVILSDESGRRCLVRFLNNPEVKVIEEEYVAREHRGNTTKGKRLIASVNTVEPRFRVMLYPHREGAPLPESTWNTDRSELKVTADGQGQILQFKTDDRNGTRVLLR